MTDFIRHVVSKNKRRYQGEGYDLDLTYIFPNIIAMGFPSEKLEGMYRNNIDEVIRFLDSRHKDHYKVYNLQYHLTEKRIYRSIMDTDVDPNLLNMLCSERSYDNSRFYGRVERFPFEDHHPPRIELIKPFCDSMDRWLSQHKNNVAVIHCKAGKGRTGVMICSYMLHNGRSATTDHALCYYGHTRTHNGKGVTIPSQQRYIDYYGQLIRRKLDYHTRPLLLWAIRFVTIPAYHGGTCTPVFTIRRDTEVLHQSEVYDPHKGDNTLDMILEQPVLICGDIMIEFYDRPKRMLKEKMFHFWFNTFFIEEKESDCDMFLYKYLDEYQRKPDRQTSDSSHIGPPVTKSSGSKSSTSVSKTFSSQRRNARLIGGSMRGGMSEGRGQGGRQTKPPLTRSLSGANSDMIRPVVSHQLNSVRTNLYESQYRHDSPALQSADNDNMNESSRAKRKSVSESTCESQQLSALSVNNDNNQAYKQLNSCGSRLAIHESNMPEFSHMQAGRRGGEASGRRGGGESGRRGGGGVRSQPISTDNLTSPICARATSDHCSPGSDLTPLTDQSDKCTGCSAVSLTSSSTDTSLSSAELLSDSRNDGLSSHSEANVSSQPINNELHRGSNSSFQECSSKPARNGASEQNTSLYSTTSSSSSKRAAPGLDTNKYRYKVLTLKKDELDKVCKDTHRRLFCDDFKVILYFTDVKHFDGMNREDLSRTPDSSRGAAQELSSQNSQDLVNTGSSTGLSTNQHVQDDNNTDNHSTNRTNDYIPNNSIVTPLYITHI